MTCRPQVVPAREVVAHFVPPQQAGLTSSRHQLAAGSCEQRVVATGLSPGAGDDVRVPWAPATGDSTARATAPRVSPTSVRTGPD
ncbi:hypothetical protein LRP67_20665 [Nocardioides sp. cx-169]|uniref:hypothetical protein n=1 Tax=Nocardioides sp. cx-169 TaxID=2899080 RepID=UPI001E4550FC|nr:hypothetical protein [Nocardioides sp. cx-169]MCD4536512.1 hypothetical protein [Nocardioides sp. cx-169]